MLLNQDPWLAAGRPGGLLMSAQGQSHGRTPRLLVTAECANLLRLHLVWDRTETLSIPVGV